MFITLDWFLYSCNKTILFSSFVDMLSSPTRLDAHRGQVSLLIQHIFIECLVWACTPCCSSLKPQHSSFDSQHLVHACPIIEWALSNELLNNWITEWEKGWMNERTWLYEVEKAPVLQGHFSFPICKQNQCREKLSSQGEQDLSFCKETSDLIPSGS